MITSIPIDTKINEFESGQKAIDYFKKNIISADKLPDAILLDLHMPNLSIGEYLKPYILIESRIGNKKILLILSSLLTPDDFEKTQQETLSISFFTKPTVKAKIVEIIESKSYYKLTPCTTIRGLNIYLQDKK